MSTLGSDFGWDVVVRTIVPFFRTYRIFRSYVPSRAIWTTTTSADAKEPRENAHGYECPHCGAYTRFRN